MLEDKIKLVLDVSGALSSMVDSGVVFGVVVSVIVDPLVPVDVELLLSLSIS